MLILVSPTEHSPAISSLGLISSLPERNGADILLIDADTDVRLGVQRKAISDFFSSVLDGRLAKEVAQLTTSPLLTHHCLIVEGKVEWTSDGTSTSTNSAYHSITRSGYRSLLTSLQLSGILVHTTTDSRDTAELVVGLAGYLGKEHHSALTRRPKQRSEWGRTTSRAFGVHLLQSFDGVGPELAGRIYDAFGGVPFHWSITAPQLEGVDGIGKVTANKLIQALGGSPDVQ